MFEILSVKSSWPLDLLPPGFGLRSKETASCNNCRHYSFDVTDLIEIIGKLVSVFLTGI